MRDWQVLALELDRFMVQFPGAKYRVEQGKTHDRVYILYGEKSRFVVISKSTSDKRALKNQLRDVRHCVAHLMGKT